jgi:hypothetical protein
MSGCQSQNGFIRLAILMKGVTGARAHLAEMEERQSGPTPIDHIPADFTDDSAYRSFKRLGNGSSW